MYTRAAPQHQRHSSARAHQLFGQLLWRQGPSRLGAAAATAAHRAVAGSGGAARQRPPLGPRTLGHVGAGCPGAVRGSSRAPGGSGRREVERPRACGHFAHVRLATAAAGAEQQRAEQRGSCGTSRSDACGMPVELPSAAAPCTSTQANLILSMKRTTQTS